MMNAHHELNMKDIEISMLKMQNEQLQNELKREKEISESFNKPNEAIKYFEQILKSPRSNNDTSGLGYTSTEEGESSRLQKKETTKVRTQNLPIISVVRKDIVLMYVEARMLINMISLRMQTIVISAKSKDIKHMNVEPRLSRHQDLRVTAITARNMDIEPLNAD